eukprot:6143035-Pleurochrysis_carterae.AAC.1
MIFFKFFPVDHHGVDGLHSVASSKRLVARGGDSSQNASSHIKVIVELAAGMQRSNSFLLAIFKTSDE